VSDNTDTTRPANVWIFHGHGAHDDSYGED
jgi:hypothetical protein